jgi:hypothetical protein
MQAILTKLFLPTDCRDARIKASCARGSCFVTVQNGHADSHIAAAKKLIQKFLKEDKVNWTTYDESKNSWWAKPFVSGSLPNGTYAHVFVNEK